MNRYTYKDMSTGKWTVKGDSRKTVFKIVAENIMEADKAFKAKTGKHPGQMSIALLSVRVDSTWGGAKVW